MIQKEIIKLHYSDSQPDKIERPDENFTKCNSEAFIVCNGITLMFQEEYPDPSPVAEVAELAGKSIVEFLDQNSGVEGLGLLTESFRRANTDVRDFNIRNGVTADTVDHIQNQYLSLTCSFGYIRDMNFYFAQLNDCGVIVFDEQGNREIDFVLNQTPLVGLLREKETKGGLEPGTEEYHVYIRNEVVNNKDLKYNGQYVNFGVMNGEHSAEDFLHFGSTQTKPGSIAVLYTDGFLPYVYDKNFVDKLFEFDEESLDHFIKEKMQEDDKYKKEKDIIALKFEAP